MTATSLPPPPAALDVETVADLIEQLGGIPPSRIRMRPLPGTATEQDVIHIRDREKRLFELIDGVLVEKAMGFRESLLAVVIASRLNEFVLPRKLGLVSGADGMMRLFPGRVRIPDVAFIAWDRIPGGRVPTEPIPDVVPNLAVEVLSRSNTRAEMERKLKEYFRTGVELAWLVDPDPWIVDVHTSPDARATLRQDQILEGGDVLRGFALNLQELFAILDQRGV